MLRRAASQLARQTQCQVANLARIASSSECSTSSSSWQAVHTFPARWFSDTASFKADLFNALPKPLTYNRATEVPAPGVQESALRRALLHLGGYYSRESQLIRGAKALYEAVVEQATDPGLLQALGLQANFADRYSLLVVHVWLLLMRLRVEGDDGKRLAQLMYENFQDDVEVRVREAGVRVRIGKWLTDLEKMFYGSSTAYDKAVKGEEELVDAVLRNVYVNDSSRRAQANVLARYMKRELACLSMTPSDAIMAGKIHFSRGGL